MRRQALAAALVLLGAVAPSARAEVAPGFRAAGAQALSRDAEARIEWITLVKRAKAEKAARAKPTGANMSRSSEGSVELIDMMRRAKARKERAGAQ